MSQQAEDDLAALVAREGRGFRGLMFAGVAVLVVLTLISAALGVFSYVVGQKLEAASQNPGS